MASSYPTFEQALGQGFAFNFVNEQRKVQITDQERFPGARSDPALNEAISSPKFTLGPRVHHQLAFRAFLVDEKLGGGGMHLTGSGGRLDVHVDFNRIEERQLFRRLNILIYLNLSEWQEKSGARAGSS